MTYALIALLFVFVVLAAAIAALVHVERCLRGLHIRMSGVF
jgi:hypothetical protein